MSSTNDRPIQAATQTGHWQTSLTSIAPNRILIRGYPLDEMMGRLGISRGNVSMNLSKLAEWGLIRRVHQRGDRRDYYESLRDVWEMFTLVASQRKRREIDPILTTLRRCRDELTPEALGGRAAEPAAQQRFHRVNDLLKILSRLDSLAQRFFESHRSLRDAVEMLTPEK